MRKLRDSAMCHELDLNRVTQQQTSLEQQRRSSAQDRGTKATTTSREAAMKCLRRKPIVRTRHRCRKGGSFRSQAMSMPASSRNLAADDNSSATPALTAEFRPLDSARRENFVPRLRAALPPELATRTLAQDGRRYASRSRRAVICRRRLRTRGGFE